MKRGISAAAAAAFVLLLATAAGAHGGLQASDPKDGARLDEVPRRVAMTFSEAPAEDSVVKVLDGCRRDVVSSTTAAGDEIMTVLGDAQPGKWRASYRVISAEDGHLTKGSLSFTVEGPKDCASGEGKGKGRDDPTGDRRSGTATPPDDDGGSFPVVPVAVGAAGLVIVGFVVRRVSAG